MIIAISLDGTASDALLTITLAIICDSNFQLNLVSPYSGPIQLSLTALGQTQLENYPNYSTTDCIQSNPTPTFTFMGSGIPVTWFSHHSSSDF